ncbi:MAG TPA: hypothetical protein VNA04_18210 [Thermoanaerobaculia bacterium]|nr:hypothetical protein [Thermoanaerobaculia bacterium]
MRPWTFIIAIALAALSASAQTPAAEEPAPTADLVAAAKEAKEKRKKSSTKPITNADVKNSKGKLIILPAREGADIPDEKEEQGLSPLAQQDLDRRLRIERMEERADAEKKVAALERELESLEQRYYEENDPDRRDKLIRKQFAATKKALEAARAELEGPGPEARGPEEDATTPPRSPEP